MNYSTQDVGIGISAAGTTQATARLLINGINKISTAAASSGVILQTADIGTSQIVFNGGANPVNVYPPVGYSINSLPANSPAIIAPNTVCEFWTTSSSTLIANLSA